MDSDKKTTSKKSTKNKVVQSRYMQSASKKASARLNFTSISEGSSVDISTSRWSRGSPSEVLKSGNRNQFMSTPASNADILCVDVSSIVADQSITPNLKEPLVITGAKKKAITKSRKAVPSGPVAPSGSVKAENKGDAIVSEAEIDIHYAQYLQAVFLESEAKISLKKRTENALEGLHKLWCTNMKLRQQSHISERDLHICSGLERLYACCNRMKNLVEPLNESLSILFPEYTALVEAVESQLKDQLHAPNVIFSAKELEPKVKAILTLMDNFLTKYSAKADEISRASYLASATCKLKDEAEQQLQECNKLLTETKCMTVEESSLKIATLQLNEEKSINVCLLP